MCLNRNSELYTVQTYQTSYWYIKKTLSSCGASGPKQLRTVPTVVSLPKWDTTATSYFHLRPFGESFLFWAKLMDKQACWVVSYGKETRSKTISSYPLWNPWERLTWRKSDNNIKRCDWILEGPSMTDDKNAHILNMLHSQAFKWLCRINELFTYLGLNVWQIFCSVTLKIINWSNFSGSFVRLPSNLGYDWVITSISFKWTQFPICATKSKLVWLISLYKRGLP